MSDISIVKPHGRLKARQVMGGSVGVGGDHPVRVQSMTNTDTRDVEGTIKQVMQLADAGCEIVRVTVQGMKEAEACEQIKNGYQQQVECYTLFESFHF